MDNAKLSPDIIPASLINLLADATDAGRQWESTAVDALKKQLKDILFVEQNGKCAYCRRRISDEPGHVEIDHILPKNSFGKPSLWASSSPEDRKSTRGYGQFRFVAHNLALTCKRCNNKKGTYDPRTDRSVDPSEVYELSDQYYEWVHIYAHFYADHIKILKGLIYQVEDNSQCGAAVISICKLDEIAAVEIAAAQMKAQTATSVSVAIGRLLSETETLGWDAVLDAVAEQFPEVSKEFIEEKARPFRDNYV